MALTDNHIPIRKSEVKKKVPHCGNFFIVTSKQTTIVGFRGSNVVQIDRR
jgi:hypothetical protein